MKIAVFQHQNLEIVVVGIDIKIVARIKVVVGRIGIAKVILSAAIEIVQKVSHQTITAAINHRYQRNSIDNMNYIKPLNHYEFV